MFVCKECHEQDRIAIGCTKSHKSHILSVIGHCAVCGKRSTDLKWCDSYKYVRSNSWETKPLQATKGNGA